MKKKKSVGLKGVRGKEFRYELSFMRMVVGEYVTGNLSQRELALKYGLHRASIQRWVVRFNDDIAGSPTAKDMALTPEEQQEQAALKKQLAQLKKEVEYLKLKELALETMIDIAKEEFNIDLRKKSGTKQSDE